MNLICGFVPRSSVETLLGRSDLIVSGGLTPAASVNADGTTFSRASCSVTTPGYPAGQALPFDVEVRPVTVTNLGIVQTAHAYAASNDAYVYPAGVGTGFASAEGMTAHGTAYSTVESGLLRGDWALTLTLATTVSTRGDDARDPLSDAVAVMQEVVDALKIPLRPTKAYPKEFYAADPTLPSPSPSR